MSDYDVNVARAAAYDAFGMAQASFPKIPRSKTVEVRTKTGGTYTFKYAPLDAINDAVLPSLHKFGFGVSQGIEGDHIITRLLHRGGYAISAETFLGIPNEASPQERGSFITYMRRYALVSLLGLATEEDDDGNHASGNTVGTASDAAVSKVDHPAPAAASPSFVEKAHAASVASRQSQRPDVPHPTYRTTSKGDRIMEAVTFVKRKADKATKDGRPIYVFDVVLEGEAVEMTTMSDRTRDDAMKFENTTARVEFVENGRFKNLWGVHPYDAVQAIADATAGLPLPGDDDFDSIPFG